MGSWMRARGGGPTCGPKQRIHPPPSPAGDSLLHICRISVGLAVGVAVGFAVGLPVGSAVGFAVGIAVGFAVEIAVGWAVGSAVALAEGGEGEVFSLKERTVHTPSQRVGLGVTFCIQCHRHLQVQPDVPAGWLFTRIRRTKSPTELPAAKTDLFRPPLLLPCRPAPPRQSVVCSTVSSLQYCSSPWLSAATRRT